MAVKQKFTNNFLDYLESIQENIKYILSFIIITNFIIIFLIKFAIRAREKFKNFFQTNDSVSFSFQYLIELIELITKIPLNLRSKLFIFIDVEAQY